MTGKELAKYRKECRLTQGELKGLDYRASLSRIESSEDPVSKSVMHRLQLAFSPHSDPKKERWLIDYYNIDASNIPMESLKTHTKI